MKYKELSVELLRKLYKTYYKNNDKNKEFVLDVIYSAEDPNENTKYSDFGKFIPTGNLEEKKTATAKKITIYENYLLSTKPLPYKSTDKSPYKYFSIPGKIQYNKKGSWFNSSLQICRPKNILANNCMSDSVWINSEINKNIVKEKPLRKAPSESATLFPIDTIKIGKNNNKWIIIQTKNGVKRWKKL